MIKKIIYFIAAILIGMLVYLVSITIESQKLQVDLLKDSFEESKYDSFLDYSTPFYKEVSKHDNNDFHVEVYKIIGKDEKLFFSYVVFINEINLDKFKIAEELTDEADSSDLKVYKNGELVYSHQDQMKLDENYIAISYGISEYGGYYFSYTPKEVGEFTIKLFNYDNNEFYQLDINHLESIDLSLDIDSEEILKYTNENDYIKASPSQNKLDSIMKSINRNMIIYGVFIIVLFIVLFRKSLFKKKKIGV